MHQRPRINPTRRTPVFALLAATALAAGGVAAVTHTITATDAPGSGPIPVAEATAALSDGATVVVPDPAVISQGIREEVEHGVAEATSRTVKEFHRDDPFSMIAVTWPAERDLSATFIRAQRADGSWGPWFDADKVDEPSATGRTGTDLIYVEPTSTVQVFVAGVDLVSPDPAAHAGTQGLDVVFIDGGTQATAQPGEQPGGIAPVAETAASDGMPPVVSRAGWGADESLRCMEPTIDDHVSAVAIHHTAGSNNYTREQAAGVVRGIYQYHARTLGWCDIGYNALVDKFGTIYEGRAGGLNKAVQGAHVGGFNQNTWGISMMGNYSTVTPSPETLESVGRLAGWRLALEGINPTDSSTHFSEGSTFTRFPLGTPVRLPRIFAHRDVGLTTCPGDAGYAQMGTIRQIAARAAQQTPAPHRDADTASEAPTTTTSPAQPAAPEATLSPGIELSDVPVVAQSLIEFSSQPDAAAFWHDLLSALQAVLGAPRSGVQASGDTRYVLFDHGIILTNPRSGAHALWGEFATQWARQGYDQGPLGLPTSEPRDVDGRLQADFEHGTITVDPATGTAHVSPTTSQAAQAAQAAKLSEAPAA